MTLPAGAGTKVRGLTYHLNLRIPAAVAGHFPPGQTHVRGSLKTADPRAAQRAVRRHMVAFDDLAASDLAAETLRAAIDALPSEQRAVFDEAGSLSALKTRHAQAPIARAFIKAPAGLTESALVGEQPSITERVMAEAAHKAELAALDQVVATEAKALVALGVKGVKDPGAFGLRELVDDLASCTGVREATVKDQRRIVDRFIGLHGDLPLTDLTIAHLREFAAVYPDFPSHPPRAIRAKPFMDVIAAAKAADMPRISAETLTLHIGILKGLIGKAPARGYLASDPWAAFELILPKGKFSEAKKEKRAPFTGKQAAAILADAEARHLASLDRWLPLLALFQGGRREELGQLRRDDIQKIDGVWCMRITDEAVGQKVKNEASVRTIPLHQKVVDAGFVEFAKTRPGEGFLFTGERGEPLEVKQGRVTVAFGKRFGTRLRRDLKITDKRQRVRHHPGIPRCGSRGREAENAGRGHRHHHRPEKRIPGTPGIRDRQLAGSTAGHAGLQKCRCGGWGCHRQAAAGALLHKSPEGQSSPSPRRIYPLASVMGVPSAVKPLRTATRTWNSAT